MPHRAIHTVGRARSDAGPVAARQGHLRHDVSVRPDALYSGIVQARLDKNGSNLPAVIRQQHGYGIRRYKTVLNVLRLAEAVDLAVRVTESGTLFAELLNEGLASCSNVRAIRVYGLLIGIELDTSRWPLRWFRKRLSSFYLYSMLRHRQFPVLVGFCQYEPNVLKITRPPSTSRWPKQIRAVCHDDCRCLAAPVSAAWSQRP